MNVPLFFSKLNVRATEPDLGVKHPLHGVNGNADVGIAYYLTLVRIETHESIVLQLLKAVEVVL